MRPPRTWGERREWSFRHRPGPKPGRSRRRLFPQGRTGTAGCSGRMVIDEPASRRGGNRKDDQQPTAGDREELGMGLCEENSGQGEHREEANPLHLSGSAVQKKLILFATSNELLVRSGRGADVSRIAIGDHVKSMPRLLVADKRKRLGRAAHRMERTHLALLKERMGGSNRAGISRRRSLDRGLQRAGGAHDTVGWRTAKLKAWPPPVSVWLWAFAAKRKTRIEKLSSFL